ncbi:MAG: hypothetical protein Q8J65_11245, partial [Nitrosomonadales bacterium]|nr:hypothetical protein [Nitrosomonadales bacterium]
MNFDAATWLGDSFVGGEELKPDAIAAVSNFTLMWNLFEGVLCPEGANASSLEDLAVQVTQPRNGPPPKDNLKEFVCFWTHRYRSGERFNDRFEGLNFRRPDRKSLVETVLSGKSEAPEDEALAILLIVYRLRNNLFHGLKTISMLNDQ